MCYALTMTSQSTEDLVAEYNERIAGRFTRCNLGSARYVARQRKIDAIVDELSNRADAGDEAAARWFEI